MENDEKILCQAKFKHKFNYAFAAIWWVIIGVAFYLTGPNLSSEHYKHMWGMEYAYPENYYRFHASDELVYNEGILALGSLITAIAFLLPVIGSFIMRIICTRCELTLTEKQIYGQVKTLFGKKKLQMPIEKLDNVLTSNGLWDKFRSGETLLVNSNSGAIKFHYVQNAGEFSAAAMKRIDEVKKSPPAPAQNAAGSDAMEKINSLKQMLDGGLISQEEFDRKKEDILSKL